MENHTHILIEDTFPSDRSVLSSLPKRLEAGREQCSMSDEQFYNLVVVLTEAVANAINHGNRGDASKNVRLRVECREEGILCIVEDQGEGFNPDAVADPIAPENLLSDGGRGLFIIRALTTHLNVERTDDGTRVEFLCARS